VIVRDDGDSWQLVMQPDHARLAGDLARAWGGGDGFRAPTRGASVIRACAHHDDGWLSWERMPRVDGDGVPATFFKVPIPRQMDFYRGVIATLDDIDPYAALLTSMHACGLYGEDLGWVMPPMAECHIEAAARFVSQYSAQRRDRMTALEIDDAQLHHDYNLLQVADRVSLHLCMRPDTESQTIQRIVGGDGTDTPLALRALEPGVISLDPFPFEGQELELELPRRTIPKRPLDDARLREILDTNAPQPKRVVVISAAGPDSRITS
jgi:hypothetical protein